MQKVKCIHEGVDGITYGKEYEVWGDDKSYYLIIDDLEYKQFFRHEHFEEVQEDFEEIYK